MAGVVWQAAAVCLGAVVVGALWASPVAALRLVVSTGKPVAVNLEVGTPTVVIFPAPIQAIPTSASKDALSLEVLGGNMMFVQLLESDYETTMFVVTTDRQMHMLRLRRAPQGLRADTQVQLLAPGGQGLIGPGVPPPPGVPGGGRRAPVVRELRLDMMEGTRATGTRHVPMEQVLIERGQLRIMARHGFMAGGLLGMIAEAENSGNEVMQLRLPEFQAVGLRAIGAERELIQPGGSVVVWLVVDVSVGNVAGGR